MPLFRRKSEKLPKTSSLAVYGQGHMQLPAGIINDEKFNAGISSARVGLDDRQQPFLAFAEVTFDPSIPMRSKSRLSKSLEEVLHDNAAIAYFIQFMDAKKAKHLVKFWLEAESFQVSALTRLQNESSSQLHVCEAACFSLRQSDSSGCFSDKSDDVFQGSSRDSNCDSFNKLKNNQLSFCDVRSKDNNSQPGESSFQPALAHCTTVLPNNNEVTKETAAQKVTLFESAGEYVSHSNTASYKKSKYHSRTSFSSISEADSNSVTLSVGDTGCDTQIKTDSLSGCDKGKERNGDAELAVEAEVLNLQCGNEFDKGSATKLKTSIEEDAKSIYHKYIAQDAPFPIGIHEELRNQIYETVFSNGEKIDPYCFLPAQEYVVKKMDNEYFPSFLRSSYHCKLQIDVLTSGNVYLADVLYNDSALFYFMEFMEQENVRHLVDFLLMADNFQKQLSLSSYDGMEAQNDAMVLYEKFFSLQASNPLGFSDCIRYEVEHNICREGGPLPDCFLKPVMILTQYLEKTYLLQFLNSQLYFKYISECIITIQSGGADYHTPKYTGSDSGSERSLPISSVNTLLAMDGKQPGASTKILKNINDQDMRIDTGQFRPDKLWQRPQHKKLQMAHVDNLGRVFTEFEPEPDRRRESKISKAVKKLVNWEEDKDQEEMAWKVAEMIVNDVCSITMGNTTSTLSKNEEEEKGPS